VNPLQPKLVTVGHILNEIIKFPTHTIGPLLGGPAAYSAVTAGMLGEETGIVTRIGTNMPSQLLKPFSEARVDTSGVKIEGEKSTSNVLLYDELGNKEIQFLEKAPKISLVDFPQNYLSAEVMHICPVDNEVSIETLGSLRERGATLSADLSGYGGTPSGGRLPRSQGNRREILRELIGHFSIVKASMDDCHYMFGSRAIAPEEVVRLFVEWHAEVAIVTLGKMGSLVATKEKLERIPVFPVKTFRDPTGAGDAYIASFLVEYLRTRDVQRSATFASATASFITEREGLGCDPRRFPARSEVEQRITKRR
jgi:2-dehydro-3-deoxygluconokinase